MKHLMTSDKFMRAWCRRPGCQASLEGGIVQDMNKKQLQEFFSGDCPAISIAKNTMTHEESVAAILKYAKEQIKEWQKMIDYWK